MKAAVTQVWNENDSDTHSAYGPFRYRLNHSYAELLDVPGLLPVAILPVKNTSPKEILKNFDMLVLTGGGDVSPSLYGREDQGCRNHSSHRYHWDIALYHAARELDIPILGICLGMQIIGIAEGVALIQDIDSSVNTPVFHDGSASAPAGHSVFISRGTFLHSVFGEKAMVSSFHHQVLEKVPPGYSISARSSDGLIEGIESNNGKITGVQWHPERDSTGRPLIEAMMRLAGKS
jgi:putative glutamine amidotransferase